MKTRPTFFPTPAEFRRWLGLHHAKADELLLGFYRKELGRGLTYPQALDEALAFGWIDGVRKNIDAQSYSIRFTPRRRGSNWSAVNIRRARELLAAGRMRPSGRRAFLERDEGKKRQYSYERKPARLSAPLAAALRARPKAAEFFAAQPAGYRKVMVFWIMSAKRPETRRRRLARLIARSAKGVRVDLLSPNRE